MSASTAQRVHAMTVASVYPLYLAKVEKKGRTRDELDAVIRWLTGYDEAELDRQLAAARQPHIHEDQRGPVRGRGRNRFLLAGHEGADLVAHARDHGLEMPGDDAVVFDDEDGGHRGRVRRHP